MEIQIERKGDIAIVHCTGSLDAETVAQFKRAVQGLCEQGVGRFVVNAQTLTFIDSNAGWGGEGRRIGRRCPVNFRDHPAPSALRYL